jgi:hypothetical protein
VLRDGGDVLPPAKMQRSGLSGSAKDGRWVVPVPERVVSGEAPVTRRPKGEWDVALRGIVRRERGVLRLRRMRGEAAALAGWGGQPSRHFSEANGAQPPQPFSVLCEADEAKPVAPSGQMRLRIEINRMPLIGLERKQNVIALIGIQRPFVKPGVRAGFNARPNDHCSLTVDADVL